MLTHRVIAIQAAERIRHHWNTHPDADEFEPVEVKLLPTYEIVSNLKDGYPPRRTQ